MPRNVSSGASKQEFNLVHGAKAGQFGYENIAMLITGIVKNHRHVMIWTNVPVPCFRGYTESVSVMSYFVYFSEVFC